MFGNTLVAVTAKIASMGTINVIVEHAVYCFFCLVVRPTQLFVVATRTFVETKSENNSEIESRLFTP